MEDDDFLRTLLPDQISGGNMNVSNLPRVWNPEANGYSTVYSMGVNGEDLGENPGEEFLIPRIKNGKYLDPQQAIDEYKTSGDFLGRFRTPEASNQYAEILHKQQELQPMINMLLSSLRF